MSRAIKKIPYKFVHVFWIDITSDSSWRSIEDVKEESLPRCLSTGFLISDEEDVIRLVSDFNFKEDGSIDECGNSTIIPKCVVQEVKEAFGGDDNFMIPAPEEYPQAPGSASGI